MSPYPYLVITPSQKYKLRRLCNHSRWFICLLFCLPVSNSTGKCINGILWHFLDMWIFTQGTIGKVSVREYYLDTGYFLLRRMALSATSRNNVWTISLSNCQSRIIQETIDNISRWSSVAKIFSCLAVFSCLFHVVHTRLGRGMWYALTGCLFSILLS